MLFNTLFLTVKLKEIKKGKVDKIAFVLHDSNAPSPAAVSLILISKTTLRKF